MRITRAQISLISGLVFILSACIGCEPEYDEVRISQQSSPPGGVYLDGDTLEVPEGVAVLIRVDPRSSSKEPYSSDADIELRPKDPGKLDVKPGLGVRQHVLLGVAPGSTCLEVVIDGSVKECIDTIVTTAVF